MNDHEKISEALDAACRWSFDAFAQRAFREVEPGTFYEWSWHIGCIAEHLEAVYRGEIKKIIINLPPRTLKSYLIARAFPAWVMGKTASAKFISTSYSHGVAEQNARGCKTIMKSAWYQRCFPETIIGELDRSAHFETTEKGQYLADSALSALTGFGCHYMVVDDPIKPMEALSETIRNSTNNNVRTTLFSRFDDKRLSRFLLMMQRTHIDDLTGNLLQDQGYVHLKLPAETKRPILIMLGDRKWTMKAGALLLPSRLSKEILKQDLLDMRAYNYSGQMLQEPVPLGGGEFKKALAQYYRSGAIKPKTMNIYIIVDAAGGEKVNKKKGKLSDFTAMAVIGTGTDGNYYLLDMIRDRLNPTERIDALFELHRKWLGLSGKPPKVGYEKYGLMTDTHYIRKKMDDETYHFALVELGGAMSKEERIRRIIPDWETGRWWFPAFITFVDREGRKFDLVAELVDSEMSTFPKGRFDDMLDAMARIKDEDMFVVFPKPAPSKTAKAAKLARRERARNWEDD